MLNKETLKEMGIKIGPRLKILQYINSLKKEEAGYDAGHESMPVECSNSNGSLIEAHVIDHATDIDNFHDGREDVDCSPRGDTDEGSTTNKDESICDDPRLVQYWNLKARVFPLEDKEKYNAITTYMFLLTCDKRMEYAVRGDMKAICHQLTKAFDINYFKNKDVPLSTLKTVIRNFHVTGKQLCIP